ncbi:MAG: beta-propeller domain-containing protein, partial [Candidatus Thermoplasmatota archaeon]|nr:beta-propeller domain-containing protein [Candidatus Thermoplasmatota archaeon]
PDEIKEDVESARNFDIADYNKRQVVEWILESYYQTLDEDERTEIQTEIQRRIQRTVVHKISVDDGRIEYKCNGTIPGRTLNQFSMDEHSGFFRVATQTDGYWQSNVKKCTNIYVLDENLEIVGEIENIAPGENMHSARFMGNRAYLVTFKNIDPFFVIDLSDPHNPEILGELKIPGYSDYLHPYDETHVIGIGKDSDASIDADKIHSDNAVYYTAILGVKIALFDVSDPENPKEVSKVVIGDRGTSTPVLNDHKAFLFDREKELLVLPINLHELKDDNKHYADLTFQGAYVYKLNLEDGFEYQGRITHQNDDTFEDGYRWYKWPSQVTRSLYIDNVLYTISDSMVKMNSLEDLSEINSVELN